MHDAIIVLYFVWFGVLGFIDVCVDIATSVIYVRRIKCPGASLLEDS